jgi:hypothetical protein
VGGSRPSSHVTVAAGGIRRRHAPGGVRRRHTPRADLDDLRPRISPTSSRFAVAMTRKRAINGKSHRPRRSDPIKRTRIPQGGRHARGHQQPGLAAPVNCPPRGTGHPAYSDTPPSAGWRKCCEPSPRAHTSANPRSGTVGCPVRRTACLAKVEWVVIKIRRRMAGRPGRGNRWQQDSRRPSRPTKGVSGMRVGGGSCRRAGVTPDHHWMTPLAGAA